MKQVFPNVIRRFSIKCVFVSLFLFSIVSTAFSQNEDPFRDTLHYLEFCNHTPEARTSDSAIRKTLPVPIPPGSFITCGNGKFRLIFMDIVNNNGYGFDDPVLGATRMNCACDVFTYLDDVIAIPSNIGTTDPTIDIIFDVSQQTASNVLAFATPVYPPGFNTTPGYYSGYLMEYILTGVKPDPLSEEAVITVNWGPSATPKPYNYCSAFTNNCAYDFYSIILHEVTHALGLTSFVTLSGGTIQSFFSPGVFTRFDELCLYYGSAGVPIKLVDIAAFAPSGINPAVPATGLNDNKLWMYNYNLTTTRLNQPINSKTSFTQGTSVAHFDRQYSWPDRRTTLSPGYSPNYVMEGYISSRQFKNKYTSHELKWLVHMGYTINATYSDFNLLSNDPPFTFGSVVNAANNWFADDPIPAGNPSLYFTTTNCVPIQISLSSLGLSDLQGDPISVYDPTGTPNGLYNIRGCGNGGNNHNQLSLNASRDIITFTPRANFIGRAQFAFHAYDGKERGAFITVTIDVTRDACFLNTPPNEIVINSGFEEGTEMRTIGSLQDNTIVDEIDMSDHYTTTFITSYWFADGMQFYSPGWQDVYIRDSYQPCLFSWPLNSFPAPGTAQPAVASGADRYVHAAFIEGSTIESFHQKLAEPIDRCNGRYIFECDIFLNGAINASPQLMIGFSNNFSGNPNLHPPQLQSFNIPVPSAGSWLHITYPFQYTNATSSDALFIDGIFANSGVTVHAFIDNISIRRDPTFPNLAVDAGAVPTPICPGGSVTIGGTPTATGGTGPYTYNWAPAMGLSCTNCANPVATPSSTTTYTLTVTDASGCVSTDQVTVNVDLGCCTATTNIPGGTYNNITWNFAGGPYAIQGNITLTGTCTFNNADIKISDGVSITVAPGAVLNITGITRMYSCNLMWKGITVQSGASLNVTGGIILKPVIEDAITAITSVNGAPVNLKNCFLNRNLIGIDFTTFFGTHPAVIGDGVTISTLPSMIPTNNILSASLDDPSQNPNGNNRGLYGIKANGNGTLNIGTNVITQATWNVFDNLDFGIYVSNVNMNINCNRFRNIRGGITLACPTPPCPAVPGTAIYASTKEKHFMNIGTSALYFNFFENNTYGIDLLDYYQVSILRNNFNITNNGSIFIPNGTRAVNVVNNNNQLASNMVIAINDNNLTNWRNGIRYIYTNMALVSNTSLNINRNTFLRTLNRAVDAIDVLAVLPASSPVGTNTWNVLNNNAPVNSSSLGITNGIEIENIQVITSLIQENNFNLTNSSPRTGVRVINCTGLKVYNNQITGTGYAATDVNHRGLYVSTSSKCEFQCNRFNNLGRGMIFEGACITANVLGVAGNKMTNNYDGLVLLNSGVIGQQGTNTLYSDNRWLGTFTNSMTNVIGTANANSASKLFLRTTATFLPPPIMNAGGLNAYSIGSGGLNPYTGGTTYQCPIIIIPFPQNPVLKSVAQDAIGYDMFDLQARWISRYQLYKAAVQDTSLGMEEPVIDSFKVASQGSSFDKLESVVSAMADTNYAAALVANSSISPQLIIEENYKTFNELFIQYATNDRLSASAIPLLETIAAMCPLEGGAVVYQARTFLDHFVYAEEMEYTDDCVVNEERSSPVASVKEKDNLYKLYPNPNNGTFTLSHPVFEEQVTVEVYDLSGRIVLKQNLSQSNTTQFSDVNVENGIYFYRVMKGTEQLSTGKIELLR